jgi:hypothetical protein
MRVLEAYVSFGERWVTMAFKIDDVKFRPIWQTAASQSEEKSEQNKKAPPSLERLSL